MADIKKLKSNLDIVAVITERGVKLVKKGANWVAHCPFHEDSTPSFSVNPAAQLWHCFGCGKGGDVFTFVMEQEHISFTEAVKKLCKRDIQTKDLEQLNREREQAEQEVAIDRPPQEILNRVVAYGQKALGRSARAQEYLKGRGLWAPELLRALRIGYSSGKLPQALPRDGKLRRQLTRIGILNKKGNDFLFNRIVCPIFDETGVLVNVYGRSLDPESEVPHLYLPGPRRGVFNHVGIRDASTVILTESILDALSLMTLQFLNTTACYGVNGFTGDIRAALVQAKTTRVYCAYDSDPAGDHAADQLAHDLANHGIEVCRVKLPVKDPNDFIKGGGTQEAFQALLDQAAVIPVAGATAARFEPQAEPVQAPAPLEDPTGPAESTPPPAPEGAFEIKLGDRAYRVESPPVKIGRSLAVLLRVTRGDRTHVDTLNLYLDQSRAKFVNRAYVAFRGQVTKKVLEEDFFAVLDEVELRAKPGKDSESSTSPVSSMPPVQREEATRFLTRPDLIAASIEDITNAGVVGEDDNKLLVYLVATSRKLAKPLSVSAISRASGGKSLVLNRILDLIPPEDVMRYTRISPRALFYEQPGRFKNKILFIEEAIGAKDADLPVRSMQSERRLSNLVTTTDPKTGELKTQETAVEGPLTFMTSSVAPLDYETATRSFEIAIDESPEQTARVVDQQLYESTLEGIRAGLAADAIVDRHRNAQRLLEPLLVVNPYAKQLRFPSGTLRLRREAGKYLSLINTLALLHQLQRPIRTFTQNGTTYRYVEVEPSDVDRANRLMAGCLTRALSDLPGTALTLLLTIRDHVTRQADERGLDVEAITFNRREIRECSAWDDHQLRDNLELLSEQEYVEVVTGSLGKRFVYRLSPDHRLIVQAGLTIDEKIRRLGLTPASELKILSGSDLAGKQPTSRRKP